jgi:hypothetical protein
MAFYLSQGQLKMYPNSWNTNSDEYIAKDERFTALVTQHDNGWMWYFSFKNTANRIIERRSVSSWDNAEAAQHDCEIAMLEAHFNDIEQAD